MAERVLSSSTIYPGDVVRFTITVTDPDDDSATDPSALTVTFKASGGTATAYVYGTDAEIVRTGTGVYYVDITPDAAHTWYVRMETDTPDDVDEYYFQVVPSEFS